MRRAAVCLALTCSFVLGSSGDAGLYCPQETYAELPSQWRGFLRDHRLLRSLAVKEAPGRPASPIRQRYQRDAARLESRAAQQTLTADEAAELGALYLRLGETARAVAVLQPAQRRHPRHFHLAANLGTAWQMSGDLAQAAACLEQAARLAPAADRANEQLHLRLVRARLRQREAGSLDDLFGVRYVGPSGAFEPGRLAAEQSKRLPKDAAARLQQLALWLPSDGPLLWQLGELCAIQGDLPTAAAILDSSVTEFGLRTPLLRAHRQELRSAAEKLARQDRSPAHDGHALLLRPRSSSPLRRTVAGQLPAVDRNGINDLPWSLLAQTHVDRHYRPTFPTHLRDLEGMKVRLTGFMQPLNEEDFGAFLLVENPIGCWHCEQPDATGIVLIQMPAGREHHYTRSALRITGRLTLNATDPETFLFIVRDAEVEDTE